MSNTMQIKIKPKLKWQKGTSGCWDAIGKGGNMNSYSINGERRKWYLHAWGHGGYVGIYYYFKHAKIVAELLELVKVDKS